MKYPILFIALMFSCGTSAENLLTLSDTKLSHILADFVVLAKAGRPESPNMTARILKVQDFGECDGSPSSCPKSKLYISVSEYGEFPEQKVFVLPESHNWEFVGWDSFPEYEGPTDYITFKVKSQRPNLDFSKSWWANEIYTVKVNYSNGVWVKE